MARFSMRTSTIHRHSLSLFVYLLTMLIIIRLTILYTVTEAPLEVSFMARARETIARLRWTLTAVYDIAHSKTRRTLYQWEPSSLGGDDDRKYTCSLTKLDTEVGCRASLTAAGPHTPLTHSPPSILHRMSRDMR